MRECDICYLEKVEDKFYNLSCCNHNLCIDCKEKLFQPYCPFCRKLVFKGRSLSTDSYEYNNISFHYIESNDDLYINSRWYRRRLRRLERDRQININNEMNRRINQTRVLNRNRRQRVYQNFQIQQEIKEYKENNKN
jgi:hypothetical protein